MLNGAVYPQPAWEHPIYAAGSSLWPTPAGHHAKMGNHDEPIESYLARVKQYEAGNYKGKPGRSLGVAVRLAAIHGAGSVAATGPSVDALGITVETLSTAQPSPEATGKLSPTWVEWLMGFPPGWTDL